MAKASELSEVAVDQWLSWRGGGEHGRAAWEGGAAVAAAAAPPAVVVDAVAIEEDDDSADGLAEAEAESANQFSPALLAMAQMAMSDLASAQVRAPAPQINMCQSGCFALAGAA